LQEIKLTQQVEGLCAIGKWQECIDICDWPNVLPTSGLFYVHLASACVQCQKYDEAVSYPHCMLACRLALYDINRLCSMQTDTSHFDCCLTMKVIESTRDLEFLHELAPLTALSHAFACSVYKGKQMCSMLQQLG